MTATTEPCASCSEEVWDTGVGCIDGVLYGFCGHENCYGMCEWLGECFCRRCHARD